jgi:hypothetical protein
MPITRSPSRLLGLILVVGLVGHLWMQTSHASQAGLHPLEDFRVASSSHEGHASDRYGQGSDRHSQQCTAVKPGDQPARNPSRDPATAPGALPYVIVDVPVAALRASPAAHLQSPRSPAHGVVLIL